MRTKPRPSTSLEIAERPKDAQWARERRAREQHAVVQTRRSGLDDEEGLYPLALARKWADAYQHVPPDWRYIRPQLAFGRLMRAQIEMEAADARQLDTRIHLFFQLLPDAMKAALRAVLAGVELQSQARENAAFLVGHALGAEQTRRTKKGGT